VNIVPLHGVHNPFVAGRRGPQHYAENAESDGGMTDYAWFVIEQDYNGLPEADWLPGEPSAAA
jgi:hypothetical protein